MSTIDHTAADLSALQLAEIVHEAAVAGDQSTVVRYAPRLADSVLGQAQQSRQQADARRDASGQEIIPADEFNALSADQLADLQERDPELYKRSISAAS